MKKKIIKQFVSLLIIDFVLAFALISSYILNLSTAWMSRNLVVAANGLNVSVTDEIHG